MPRMSQHHFSSLVLGLLLTIAGCGDDRGSDGVDAGPGRDAGGGTDAGSPSDGGGIDTGTPVDGGVDGGTPVDGGGGGPCGSMRPDITGIRGTEGLVIGRDGTIY